MSDLINRQKALDALWKALHEYEDKTEKQFQESDELDVGDWINHRIFVQNMNDIDRQTILDLPAAEPELKTGKWNRLSEDTFHCLECGKTFMVMQGKDNMNFCPNCGADMRTIVEGEG